MKRTLLLLFTLTTTAFVNGQVVKSIGIKGGVSVASQTWHYKSTDLTLKKDNRIGFYSAITLEFFKSKYLSLTTDFSYCEKGSTEKIQNTTVDMPEGDGTYKTYDTKFGYFTLSPMLKGRYETAHFVPYALLGLRLDYQLSYKSDFNYQQIEKDFHKAIFGANFGIGAEYKIKHLGIFLETQYHYDFTKLMDTPSSANNTGIEINNRAFIISIGLKYYLKKKEDAK